MDILQSMGFDLESAQKALERSGGDVERALEILLNPPATTQRNVRRL